MFKKAVKKAVSAGQSVANVGKGVVATAVVAGASVANAAVTFDKTTGQLEGSLDTANYYTGVEIGVGFMVITMITGAGIYAMKRFGK